VELWKVTADGVPWKNLGVSRSGSSPYEKMIIIGANFCQGEPNQDASPNAAQAPPERFCSPCRFPPCSLQKQSIRQAEKGNRTERRCNRRKTIGTGEQNRARRIGHQVNRAGQPAPKRNLRKRSGQFPGMLKKISFRTASH
jgi:hypothetical protein